MPILRAIRAADFPACIDFLVPREHRCVTLMSHLVQGGAPAYPERRITQFVSLAPSPGGEIDGILLVTKTGILLHCFREDTDISPYAPSIGRFLAQTPVRCVIGARSGTILLESLLHRQITRTVDYQLMTLDNVPEPDDGAFDDEDAGSRRAITIRRGGIEDADHILPLQEDYERVEVIPPGDALDRNAIRAKLLHALNTQYVFLAVSAGEIVAKAGTNALGLNWDQIGGVYTLPAWRGRGIGTRLVAHTARKRMLENRRIALFVKLTNLPARRAYDTVGFKSEVFFRISYI